MLFILVKLPYRGYAVSLNLYAFPCIRVHIKVAIFPNGAAGGVVYSVPHHRVLPVWQ